MNTFSQIDPLLNPQHLSRANAGTKHNYRFVGHMIKKIKYRLGEHSYYIDEYMSHVYAMIAQADPSRIGCERVIKKIMDVCDKVCSGQDCDPEDKVYQEIKSFIDSHPTDFLEHSTKIDYYAANFMMCVVKGQYYAPFNLLKEGLNQYEGRDELDKCYLKIAELIGQDLIDILNEAIVNCFILAPAFSVAKQRLITAAFELYLHRDPQSSKFIFQL